MFSSIDILIVGQQAWDIEIGSNCKNIALEFSKTNRVLFINPPLDRISIIRGHKDPKVKFRRSVVRGEKDGMTQINHNLWVYYPDIILESINWIRSKSLFLYLNWYNNKRFAFSIKRALQTVSFQKYILFNDSDMFRSFHLKELLVPQLSIYYSRDNMLATEYWRRHGVHMEPAIIKKSDLCLANSEYLREYCSRYNQNSFYVGQGCDLELSLSNDDLELPKEISILPGPVIGYVGVLSSSRLDIDLLSFIADSRPEWNIVLIGPEDIAFAGSALHKKKNVVFTGPKPVSELSKYINSFDVCINPQILNDLTIGNYPRKIDEYLVSGKPVVATKTEAMATFKDYVLLADSKHDFVQKIVKALNDKSSSSKSARIRFGLSHTWENSVSLITMRIQQLLQHNMKNEAVSKLII